MEKPQWFIKLKNYEGANLNKSILQIFSSIVPFFALLAGMYLLIKNGYPYWTVLILALFAAGFHVRIFIIFHDCVHYSFFRSRLACDIMGHITGILTFTAFYDWQRSHVIHHGTVGNLEKRGIGDVWTMTVAEYKSAGKGKRLRYRLFRHPVFLFIIAPILLFLISNRIPKKNRRKKELFSIIFTNIMILLVILAVSFTIGFKYYLAIQLPVIVIAAISGVWLFYIQHQFENPYWANNSEWDPTKAAMAGSSYYKLPGILRWFSGNIGFHHIHHLRPRIPNYLLRNCYKNIAELQDIKPITLWHSFNLMFLQLLDEKSGKLVSISSITNQLMC
jgi:acyl-lipid omega-6 desaturase (Delta-12 desaturase)